jgi:hypothetical protein
MIKNFSSYINEQYANPVDSFELKYGNPQKYQKEKMDAGSDLYRKIKNTDLWKKWTSKVPPLQTSDDVRKEIEELIMLGNSQNEEDLKFVKNSENDLKKMFLDFLRENGTPDNTVTKEDLSRITNELDPITYSLKYHFNYPRPYQIASQLELSLYPSQPTDACSPAYPSGHSIDSFVIAGLIGKKYPQLRMDVERLASRISRSRLQGGIHFPMDAEFGKEIAEDILGLNFISL